MPVCDIFSPYLECAHEGRQSVPPSKVSFIFQRENIQHRNVSSVLLPKAEKLKKKPISKNEQILSVSAQA